MQRINYFTNPNFTGPFADVNISGEVKASYNADTYDKAVGGGFRASSPATRCHAHRSVRRAGDVR